MSNDDTPTYNLKAVVRETGLKPDTLRAWERRYGIPEPQRTDGGHRLYSQNDINTLKWLLQRQDEGMSISRAVALCRSLQAEGRDPFQEHPLASMEQVVSPFPVVEIGETVADMRQAWIKACLAFDERAAEVILTQAFSYYSPEVVCFEVLQKGLVEIGNRWYEGQVSVQQEHFASALAMRRLDTLLAATPPPTRPGRVIVGCPPGENHTFSPLLLTLLLRRRGWDVVYLGADVPTNRLRATIEHTKPELAVFSAQLLDSVASLLDVADDLQEANVPLAFGGYVFGTIPQLRERVPGHFLGNDLSIVPQVVEQLIQQRPATPAFIPVSEEYQLALAHFRERSGMIVTHVWRRLRGHGMDDEDLEDANHYLTANIISALKLGDLAYIDPNLQWLEGMMVNYDLPPNNLHRYLTTYREVAGQVLDAAISQPILEWFDVAVEASELYAASSDRDTSVVA